MIEELWPDPDRRHDALLRLAEAVYRDPLPLTEAETLALTTAARGLRWRESAELLGVAPDTVRWALVRARQKLRAKNTTHAVAEALRRGLIQ